MQKNEDGKIEEKISGETAEEKYRRMEEEMTKAKELIRQLEEENRAFKADPSPEDAVIESFLVEFPGATDFFDDICRVLEEDASLAGAEGLHKAYTRVLSQKYQAPEQLAQDEDFLLNYIFCNEKIREKFIRQYLDSLPQAPDMCEKRGAIPVSAHSKPATLRSAGELARALFRK